ncbi:MAG: HD-like signal output (HDOD) protein [Planctomycetota bacterium]|jgi:HD-like signal output (HDOD) protein
MKNIIFVDDDQNILSGLKRMLRPRRDSWDMSFALSGQEALDAMEERPFDVIISDMKMPGMNGAELLSRVHESHPETVRIILSGHSDMEATIRSIAISHQFLTKPCDAKMLCGVVDRACGLQALLHSKEILSAVGSVSELPVLPRVYKALTVALAEEEVDIDEVAEIVEKDAGIAAKVMQLVNSSYFGLQREVSTFQQATIHLGCTTIRDLVLSFEVFNQFSKTTLPAGFSIEKQQHRSMLAARIARRLLDDKLARDQSFMAAMLHDVGKLVLATALPEKFSEILVTGADTTRSLHEVERDVLGVSHSEIGAYLLGLWGMPYPIVEAVAHHHTPANVPGQESFGLLGVTHVAAALAHEQCDSKQEPSELDEPYLMELGVADRLPEWRSITEEEAGVDAAA